ncbi:MAG TPA: hypothetical protein VEJ63_23585 [Planctomycetota bacterium]|nr:hypothetical protein [Planctomycetota bacterium]
MRSAFLILSLSCVAAFCTDSPPPRGPLVDIVLRDGSSYQCMLLQMHEGRMEVVMGDGERRSSELQDVRAIKFLPVPKAPQNPRPEPPEKQPAPDPRPPEKAFDDPEEPAEPEHPRGGLTPEEMIRLRQLNQKDRDGRISAAEAEELKKLRERGPILPKLGKVKIADENARLEASKGRIENYINTLQSRLKNADTDDDVKDAMLALGMAYRQKSIPGNKIGEMLRADAETIIDPKVRERAKERTQELADFLKNYRGR